MAAITGSRRKRISGPTSFAPWIVRSRSSCAPQVKAESSIAVLAVRELSSFLESDFPPLPEFRVLRYRTVARFKNAKYERFVRRHETR